MLCYTHFKTCLATNQGVAGCEKLLQKVESSSTLFKKICKMLRVLPAQDKLVFRQVTKLLCMVFFPRNFNQSEFNVVKQVARFCCPFHCSLRQVPKRFLLVLITKLKAERGGGTQFQSICKRDLVTMEGFSLHKMAGAAITVTKNLVYMEHEMQFEQGVTPQPILLIQPKSMHVLKNNMIDDRLGFQIDNQALKRFITKIQARC